MSEPLQFDKVLNLSPEGQLLQRRLDISFDKIVEYSKRLLILNTSTIAAGAAVSLITNIAKDVTTLSLSPGDWDVFGTVYYNPGVGTTTTNLQAAVSSTSLTLPSAALGDELAIITGFSPTSIFSLAVPQVRFSVSETMIVYLVAYATFTVSTMTAFGSLKARRVG